VKKTLFLLGAMLATAGPLRAQDEGISIGSPAPAVTVPDLDGHPVDLGGFLGRKPVLLEFWATWCEVCRELMPRMEAAQKRYGDRVEFVGINIAVGQTREEVRNWLKVHRVPFVVLYDEEGVSVRAYDAAQTSYIVIVDALGNVAYTGLGTSQRFEAALARVAPDQ
jgi:thiol-disulfide isomerase/thioredoxin